MSLDPHSLPSETLEFLTERHLASLTTVGPGSRVHAVLVGFSFEQETALARVISMEGTQKIRNIDRGSRAALLQFSGGRWLSLEGPATVTRDPERVAEAVRRYGERYRQPEPNPQRVAIEISVERILGR